MAIPEFSEFLASLDKSSFGATIDSVNLPHIISFSETDKEASKKAIELVYQEAIQVSGKITISLLREYHNWLLTKIQQ